MKCKYTIYNKDYVTQIKSNNTNNCLQNNFGSLSIEPCVVRKGQRWSQLNEFNKCTV